MTDVDDEEVFRKSRTDKTYVSSAFNDFRGQRLRIANKYIDGCGGYEFANVKEEIVLRQTDAGRFQIKATFIEDDRGFRTVTIQKYTAKGNAKESFTFLAGEVARLLKFLTDIKRINFPDAGKINITDNDLENLLLQPDQARTVMASNPRLLAMLAREQITEEDVIALGYRRKQLALFEQLLDDPSYFTEEVQKSKKGPEQVWQNFFQKNQWIFGFGLSLIYFDALDNRPLETRVTGNSLTGPGKIVDALLKSQDRKSVV